MVRMSRISLKIGKKSVSQGDFFLTTDSCPCWSLRNFPPILPPFLEMTTRQSLPVAWLDIFGLMELSYPPNPKENQFVTIKRGGEM